MKRFLTFLVVILAIVPMAFTFTGCFDDEDAPKSDFAGAVTMSLPAYQEIILDEAYSLDMSENNFNINLTMTDEQGAKITFNLYYVIKDYVITAEGFYSRTATDEDDCRNAKFYVFDDKLYVNRAETTPVLNTDDAECYGKFYCDYQLGNHGSVLTSGSFARELASLIDLVLSEYVNGYYILGSFADNVETTKRKQVNRGTELRIKVDATKQLSSVNGKYVVKAYINKKIMYKLVFESILRDKTTNVITKQVKTTATSYTGKVNTDIPTNQYRYAD